MKKFDAEAANKIINYLRAGAFIETAAAAAGIARSTLYEWLRRGRRKHHGAMFEFAEEAEQAQAMSEVAAIGIIGKAAGSGQWQAAAWHLERKYPARWGRREHLEMTGKDGGPIETHERNPRDMTTGERRALLAELLGRGAEPGEPET
jgi:hypothetical protein